MGSLVSKRIWQTQPSAIGLLVLALAVGGDLVVSPSNGDEAAAYQGPSALAASPDGTTLYVANADVRQVAWVGCPGAT